jgi:hypothetical protein
MQGENRFFELSLQQPVRSQNKSKLATAAVAPVDSEWMSLSQECFFLMDPHGTGCILLDDLTVLFYALDIAGVGVETAPSETARMSPQTQRKPCSALQVEIMQGFTFIAPRSVFNLHPSRY